MARNRRTRAEDDQMVRNISDALDAAHARMRVSAPPRETVADDDPNSRLDALDAALRRMRDTTWQPLRTHEEELLRRRRLDHARDVMDAQITPANPEWQEMHFVRNGDTHLDRLEQERWTQWMRGGGWTVHATHSGAIARKRVATTPLTLPSNPVWDDIRCGGVGANEAMKDMETLEGGVFSPKQETTEQIVERAICRSIAGMASSLTLEQVLRLYRRYRSFDVLWTIVKVVNNMHCTIEQAEGFMKDNVSMGSGGQLRLEISEEGGVRLTQLKDHLAIPMPGDVRRGVEATLEQQTDDGSGFLND